MNANVKYPEAQKLTYSQFTKILCFFHLGKGNFVI